MEPLQPKIEIPLPEQDVKKIEENLEFRGQAENSEAHTAETVRQSIKSVSGPVLELDTVKSSQPALDVLPDYANKYPAEAKQRIEDLLQVAADKGLDSANGMAKNDPPYILDAFHDALAEKLLPYLKQKGIIK